MVTKYEAMEAVMAPLWRIPASQARGIFQQASFKRFERHCRATHENVGKNFSTPFALMDGLRAVGIPCDRPPNLPAVDVAAAARDFVDALDAPSVTRRYLAPLNLADELPSLRFGNAWVTRLTSEKLQGALEYDRLLRQGHNPVPDVHRLAQLQWLVVEQPVPTARSVAERASRLFLGFEADPGAIDPHEGRYPAPLMDALFALLLAPWEDWHDHGEYDWRSFSVPWVHVATGDIFNRPREVPSAESLAWEPYIYGDGEEGEKPAVWALDRDATPVLTGINDAYWALLKTARDSSLFDTPIEHFMLRAFFSDGMDEIIAHMTAIEAAIGLQSDYTNRGRRGSAPLSPRQRVVSRISLLLDDVTAGGEYDALFDIRSEFVHGRKFEDPVPGQTRNLARRLARRVVVALIEKAVGLRPGVTREEFLTQMA